MNKAPETAHDGVRSLVGYFLFVLAVGCAGAVALPPTLALFEPLPRTVLITVIVVGNLAAIGGAKAFGTLQNTGNKLMAGLCYVVCGIALALALISVMYQSETTGETSSLWRDTVSIGLFAAAFGIPGLKLVMHRRSKQSPQIL